MKPRSVYRGQAKTGLGEGPNKPIAHGEQYLSGTADELYDEGLLQAIRPWLTLDSESADHNRLGDNLEGWSYFAQGDLLFVTRLVSAGIYDRRAAYFSHARAWPLAECRQAQSDPAAYLGCSGVFDPPRDENQPAGISDGALSKYPEATLPQAWNPALHTEAAVAVQFLGHLLQSLEQGYPLLIQAPLEDFTRGAALATLVAFAHAALPYGLKQACAVRLYTRHPERFARHLGTQLIVLPEESARDAFAASPRNATLLDRNGTLIVGAPLQPAFELYAEVATHGALGAPHALLPFSAYLGRGDRSLLWRSGNGQWLQLAYLIAMALAGDTDYRAGMFRHHILPQAADGLPWDTLLSDAEWLAFFTPDLAAFLLSPADTPAVEALQDAAAQALQRGAKTLDSALANAWRIDDPRQIQHLLELLAEYPALLTPAVVARHTATVPLSRLQGIAPLYGLLNMELNAGVLNRRSTDAEGLAQLAEDPDNYAVLMAATRNSQLDLNWARYLPAHAKPDIVRRLALDLWENPTQWPAWGAELLDRLRAQPDIIDEDMRAAIAGFGNRLDIFGSWDTYIKLAELLLPADPETGDFSANPLSVRLWTELSAAEDLETRKKLLDLILDPNWKCLTALSLFTPNGEFKLPTAWCEEAEFAERLLNNNIILERLDISRLLQSLWYASPRLGDGQVIKVYQRATQCWTRNSQATTNALVRWGAWYGWRRSAEAGLSKEQRRLAVLEWLRCPHWRAKPNAEATWEAWTQVVGDLATTGGLSGVDMQSLRAGADHQGGPLWPQIPPFEEKQTEDIARLATDLAVLAECAEAVSNNNASECDNSLKRLFGLYKRTRTTAENFPHTGLYPIIGVLSTSAPRLTLEQSSYLCGHSGHRRDMALEARREAVLETLHHDPITAFDAADNPNLWMEEAFVNELARWLGGRDLGSEVLTEIEAYFSQHKKTLPTIPSETRRKAAGILRGKNFLHIAKCLNPSPENLPSYAGSNVRQTPNRGFVKPPLRFDEIPDDNRHMLMTIFENTYDSALWSQFGKAKADGRTSYSSNNHPIIISTDYNDDILSLECQQNLSAIIAQDPTLPAHISSPGPSDIGPRLPLFELYSSMGKKDDIAASVRAFLRDVNDNNKVLLENKQWWIAFINSIKKRCFRFPDNSLNKIVATILIMLRPEPNRTIIKMAEDALAETGLLQKYKASI